MITSKAIMDIDLTEENRTAPGRDKINQYFAHTASSIVSLKQITVSDSPGNVSLNAITTDAHCAQHLTVVSRKVFAPLEKQ
jgi:hypothetical protein